MKLRTVIIDDELNAIKMIEFQLQKHFKDIEIVGTALDIKNGINVIKTLDPDILFLDIELKDGSGFEIREATKEKKYQLIFITAYSQYAIKAFKAKAIDYVLKPLDEQDFCEAVNRAIENISLPQKNNSLNKLLFTTHKGNFYYSLDEIIFIKADSNYTYVQLTEDRHLTISKTLKEIEQKLPNDLFLRVHNSYVINSKFITGYQNGDGGILFLNNNFQIPISRSRKIEVSNFLKQK